MRDPLQTQARALGDPTRHGIFRFVADADRPVGVAELTTHLGLNHNAVRQHLAKLVDAGLLVEATAAPTGRGRPRLVYTLDPASESRWGVTGPYERLAVLLSEMVRTGDAAEDVGHRAGVHARMGALEPTTDPVVELNAEMARQGFAPALRQTDDRFTLVLTNCPFTAAVMTDQSTICRLHLGLARGAAEAIGGIEVDRLVPHDPRRANCQLDCRVVEPDDGTDPGTDAGDVAAGDVASGTAAAGVAPVLSLAPAGAGPDDLPPDPPSTAGPRPDRALAPGTELR